MCNIAIQNKTSVMSTMLRTMPAELHVFSMFRFVCNITHNECLPLTREVAAACRLTEGENPIPRSIKI